MKRPNPLLRAAAAVFRRIPTIRGRGRAAKLLGSTMTGRHFSEVVRVYGGELEVLLDDVIGRTIYLDGVWEAESTAAIHHLAAPGAVVLDVGANAGYYTLLFSALAGAGGKVYAFEPVPSMLELLRRNIARNAPGTANVAIMNFALSDAEGTVEMNVAGTGNTGASHVVAPDAHDQGRYAAGVAETIQIRSRTADAVWRELGRPPVSLVKLDIEGHELHALRGMRETLDESPEVTVLVEVRETFLRAAGGSAAELFSFLAARGLRAWDFDPRSGRFTRNDTVRSGPLVIFSKRSLA